MDNDDFSGIKSAVIGLGYVGLPLAIEFGKSLPVVGYDIDIDRILSLQSFEDKTNEIEYEQFKASSFVKFTRERAAISDCNVFVITVPTPIDKNKQPDLSPIVKASEDVAGVLKPGDTVIYESTVYPGVTEDICAPILEKGSGLVFNKDFFVGYSPERINPGDKSRRLPDIVKITSGSTQETADFVDRLYGLIIRAGTYKANTIKVAEAAKVIENTQRDLNIALVNELAMIFDLIGIDTHDVLTAAGTKWNFLPFKPGLVGGHCIGVDPYYLTHKAQEVGHFPQVILAGRKTNDSMGQFIANQVIRLLSRCGARISETKILLMGVTFKEDCPDTRNTRVFDIAYELRSYGASVDVADPIADINEVKESYSENLVTPNEGEYEAVIVAVAHKAFTDDVSWDAQRFITP